MRRGQREAAPEERRLPRDRRDGRAAPEGSTARPSARSACSCTTRSTTSSRTRPRCRPAVFAEQMALLGELGYVPVSLEQVRDHYVDGAPLPAGAVLITLRRRLPRQPRERAADPPAPRLSGGDLRPDRLPRRRSPAAARGGSARARRAQPDARLGRARGARRRRHSGRVARDRRTGRSPSSSLAEAAREIALSKLRLEERLGRPVEAYAFVKGSLADYRARAREPRAAGRVRRSASPRSPARTARRATASGSAATTSSRTRRARSSSCSPAPATSSR